MTALPRRHQYLRRSPLLYLRPRSPRCRPLRQPQHRHVQFHAVYLCLRVPVRNSGGRDLYPIRNLKNFSGGVCSQLLTAVADPFGSLSCICANTFRFQQGKTGSSLAVSLSITHPCGWLLNAGRHGGECIRSADCQASQDNRSGRR